MICSALCHVVGVSCTKKKRDERSPSFVNLLIVRTWIICLRFLMYRSLVYNICNVRQHDGYRQVLFLVVKSDLHKTQKSVATQLISTIFICQMLFLNENRSADEVIGGDFSTSPAH